ncbi:hypothetical protein BC629DRAFT_961282 [Irpex lacteus]|nr:hypothetical protein BC629DRAFT_961282 [Irpex lacteus]
MAVARWLFSTYLALSGVLHQVNSQLQQPECLPQFEWLYNNESQSPCAVNTYLCRSCRPPERTCIHSIDICTSASSFNYLHTAEWDACIIGTIPSGFVYENYESPLYCDCSTVEWMLLGACGACQGGGVVGWSTYQKNCTELYLYKIPGDIPVNTSIPAWAYLELDENNDDFNLTRIQDFVNEGGHPDSSAIITTPTGSSSTSKIPTTTSSQQSTEVFFSETLSSGPSPLPSSSNPPTSSNMFSWSSTATSSATSLGTAVSSATKENSIVPPIVGGIVGGVAGIAAIVGAFMYWFTRRKVASRRKLEAEQATLVPSQSDWKNGSRIYNPNDPTTYPLVDAMGNALPTPTSFPHTSAYTLSFHSSPPTKMRDDYRGLAEVS